MFEFEEKKKEIKKIKWSEKLMLNSVYSIFKQNLFCVSNVSWGFFGCGREADFLTVSKSHFLTEVEIKISVADLRKDKDKKHLNLNHYGNLIWSDNRISALYYAMPTEIWDKVKDNPPIPDEAGVIVIRHGVCPKRLRKPKRNQDCRKLNEKEFFGLARLGAIKFWSQLNKNLQKNDKTN